jgi:hypothetical protein
MKDYFLMKGRLKLPQALTKSVNERTLPGAIAERRGLSTVG